MTVPPGTNGARTRWLAPAIVALFLVLAGGTSAAPPKSYRAVPDTLPPDRRDSIRFPDLIGALSHRGTRKFADSARGVGAWYEGKDEEAVIIVYDLGIADIPADIDAAVVRAEFETARHDYEAGVSKGLYKNLKSLWHGEIAARLPWREVRFLDAVYEVEMPPSPGDLSGLLSSHVYLTALDGVFIKLFHKYPAGPDAAERAQDFLEAFAGILALRYFDSDWKSEEDFRRAEPLIRDVAQWLVADPVYPPDDLRMITAAHVSKWVYKVPYLSVPLEPEHLQRLAQEGTCECEDFLVVMFTIGCGLRAMDAPEADPAEIRVSGTEFALRAYAKLVAKGSKFTACTGLAPFISAAEAGTLAAALQE